ncbi:hypothetical protein [Nitrosophilus alvini]|uniref:hypothetical protein n=1 Tax=Nitrosophilus alvini TaxID=2714855 RepID=UPI00190BBF7D|nr:hypothetical protein [Nitrosophilus alvini]
MKKTLKSLQLLLAAMLLIPLFSYASDYKGFMKPKPGAWAKYLSMFGQDRIEIKNIYVGEEDIGGKKVYVIETRTRGGFGSSTSQIWMDKKDEKIIKIVMKNNGQISCISGSIMDMGVSAKNDKPSVKTPKKFDPKRAKIKYKTYKTPKGKTVKAAVFEDKDNKYWVSSSVPFGIVKIYDKKRGKDIMYLYDFGLSDAKPSIPILKARNCKPMNFPAGIMEGNIQIPTDTKNLPGLPDF